MNCCCSGSGSGSKRLSFVQFSPIKCAPQFRYSPFRFVRSWNRVRNRRRHLAQMRNVAAAVVKVYGVGENFERDRFWRVVYDFGSMPKIDYFACSFFGRSR